MDKKTKHTQAVSGTGTQQGAISQLGSGENRSPRMNAFKELTSEEYFHRLYESINKPIAKDNKTRVRMLSRHGLLTLDGFYGGNELSFFELIESKVKNGMQVEVLLWLSHLDMPIARGLQECIRNLRPPEHRMFKRGGYLDVRVAPSLVTGEFPGISPFVCIADRNAKDGVFMLCAPEEEVLPTTDEIECDRIRGLYRTYYTDNLALSGVRQQVRLFDSVFEQSRGKSDSRSSVMHLSPAAMPGMGGLGR